MKILVVVDYQNDFVVGSLGFPSAVSLDAGIANKVREYGEGNVFYTLDSHGADYLDTREGKALPVLHCVPETEGWNVFGETALALNDVKAQALAKTTFGLSPYTMVNSDICLGRHMDRYLGYTHDIMEVESVEFVGVVTNICVLSNVVTFQARYPEAQITVDASLCASFDPVLHEKALDVMEGLQVRVINR